MNQHIEDLRKQTLNLVQSAAEAKDAKDTPAAAVIETWLAAIEEEDVAGVAPEVLASALWQGFSEVLSGSPTGCRIGALRYTNSREAGATALLIANPDMPFLVDSIVMALRRQRVVSRAVINAVLSVRRDASGRVTHVARASDGKDPLESYVLCLLAEELAAPALSNLVEAIRGAAGDAATVHRDAPAMREKMKAVASSSGKLPDAPEVSAFLAWAEAGGFELFGYAYYRVVAGEGRLTRDLPSRIGVLRDASHPVYDTCLAGIPEDFATQSGRVDSLSIVKADTESTLHRDQKLDFIGVRDVDAKGEMIGEHCFLGLFSRSAALTPLAQLPFARGRIKQVLSIAGVRPEGFRAEKFLDILESLPRTEIMEATPEWLAEVSGTVVALYKQPRAKVFSRRDVYGRHLNVLVYLPRERYSAGLAETLSQKLHILSGATDVTSQVYLAEGPLARLYLIAKDARAHLDLDGDVARPLLSAIEGWHTAFEELVDESSDPTLRTGLRRLCLELPADYIAATSPRTAFHDLSMLGSLRSVGVKVHIETGWRGMVNVRLLSAESAPSLSNILPALHNAGVAVDREQTFTISGLDGTPFFVTCLTVDSASATKLTQPHVSHAAQELFQSLFNNEVEDGRMNGLVIEAGLRQKEVQLMRAYASYWRQTVSRFSLRYIADCLRKEPAMVRALVDAFAKRFDPALPDAERAAGTAALHELKHKLADLNHADTEDILRAIADLMLATLRTSYFQDAQTGDTVLFKFDSGQLSFLPEPRPFREIYVFSRRFEGVHLRGGPVARGGLRWSDRMEDYRTEVLGLVKAQMVKNAVIVPAGAKGGFVCKMMPKDATREVIAQEGESVYRLFIAGLLDLTDNRVRGEIIRPAQTVCYDEIDPYLVVAADKGTATFSDIANSIAVQRGFWLGDAFASGGSNGYDHKKLGITAKGAWEAVKRHFYEIGHNLNTSPIAMVGIGDMSGDVFGNGVLLSKQIKLVAAFDHRHIFLDPTPDTASSFVERQRMFALPRSSWEDYDKSLISKGGGVFPRTVRSIELSHEARSALGTELATVTPEQLMHIILKAPVDLFYNGGIGTYIKAASETHAQVKDRANDAIRVNGSELRCKVVSEGGNLGATQAGRIEFALKGGRVYTDAIDNSAGVDCSDHEVNVKIWLDTEVNAGKLAEAERNRILNDLTQDIEVLVLRDNILQTHLLAREEQAQRTVAVQDGYAALIASLEAEGVVSRELEQLPSAVELARRKGEGVGLTAPELAVVIANVKNRYKRILSAMPLLENSWAKTLLTPYFPAGLVATRNPMEHPLANAILATVLANEAVNRCGPLMLVELAARHQVEEGAVILAWAQAWSALNLAPLFGTLDAHALTIPTTTSKEIDARARVLQLAVTGGFLSVAAQLQAQSVAELVAMFHDAAGVERLIPASAANLGAFERARATVDAIAAMADFLFAALTIARPAGLSLQSLLQTGVELRRGTGIDALEQALATLPVAEAQTALRNRALDALRHSQQHLLSLALRQGGAPVQALVARLQRKSGAPTTLEEAVLDAWALSDAATAAAA